MSLDLVNIADNSLNLEKKSLNELIFSTGIYMFSSWYWCLSWAVPTSSWQQVASVTLGLSVLAERSCYCWELGYKLSILCSECLLCPGSSDV